MPYTVLAYSYRVSFHNVYQCQGHVKDQVFKGLVGLSSMIWSKHFMAYVKKSFQWSWNHKVITHCNYFSKEFELAIIILYSPYSMHSH